MNDTRRWRGAQVRQTFLRETGRLLWMEQREELAVAPNLQVVGGTGRTEIPLLRQETTDGGRK